jgi:flavin reductase (DIM6/NTAB) family NADH-FMN oxidoreductase RutF
MEASEIAQGVGHIPSGLFIIVAEGENQIDGYLASWVQQVSFSPLLVSFAINSDRPGYEAITSGKTFSINIVGDHDTQYMRHFWSGYEESPFNQIEHERFGNNAVAIRAAKSVIECEFVSKTKPGDHELVVARVISSIVMDESSKPKVHIRKSGLDY